MMSFTAVFILVWGILRKWQRDMLQSGLIAWVLAWLGYLIFDLIQVPLNFNVLKFKAYGSTTLMALGVILGLYLAIKYKWPRRKVVFMIMFIYNPLIGYWLIAVFSAPIYVALPSFGIISFLLNLGVKYRMG